MRMIYLSIIFLIVYGSINKTYLQAEEVKPVVLDEVVESEVDLIGASFLLTIGNQAPQKVNAFVVQLEEEPNKWILSAWIHLPLFVEELERSLILTRGDGSVVITTPRMFSISSTELVGGNLELLKKLVERRKKLLNTYANYRNTSHHEMPFLQLNADLLKDPRKVYDIRQQLDMFKEQKELLQEQVKFYLNFLRNIDLYNEPKDYLKREYELSDQVQLQSRITRAIELKTNEAQHDFEREFTQKIDFLKSAKNEDANQLADHLNRLIKYRKDLEQQLLSLH